MSDTTGNPLSQRRSQSYSGDEPKLLSLNNSYRCPVCRYGEISAMPLMDAFSCHFCHHIFSADLSQQLLAIADSEKPLKWYWNGRRWQGAHRSGVKLGWEVWLSAVAFVALPPSFVWLGAHLFPPLPDDPLAWFPDFWTVSTFCGHLIVVTWLIAEYYQFPLFVFLRAWRRQLFR